MNLIRPVALALLLLLSATTWADAQRRNPEARGNSAEEAARDERPESSELDPEDVAIYQQALRYNDFSTAIVAVHEILVETPSALTWKDTLASLYFYSGQSLQALSVANELLLDNPSDERMLEVKAISLQNLGVAREALSAYEDLYRISGNLGHLYQIATLQYQLKRYGECEISLNRLIQAPESQEMQVSINMGQGRQQRVPLVAASYNIYGVVQLEQNRREAAKAAFQKAVEAFPEFVLAKNNLRLVEQADQEGQPETGQTNPTPNPTPTR